MWQDTLCTGQPQYGPGGGGGGGGAGAVQGACAIGAGGGGGGAGAPGGGVVMLIAEEAIVVAAPIDVSGGDVLDRSEPATTGQPTCGADPSCGDICEPALGPGRGGSGAGSGLEGLAGGLAGGPEAGAGAPGGPGAGGYILLRAPSITWEDGARLVLGGGRPAGEPGVLHVDGTPVGPTPLTEGEPFTCPNPMAPANP
jgi:hypothetical protein